MSQLPVSSRRIPVADAPVAIQTMAAGTSEVMETTNMDGSKSYLFVINEVVTAVRACHIRLRNSPQETRE